jgi:hypothetical protein
MNKDERDMKNNKYNTEYSEREREFSYKFLTHGGTYEFSY